MSFAFFGGVTARKEKVHYRLMAVGSDTDFLVGSEKRHYNP